MTDATLNDLLEQLKDDLSITWTTDEAETRKLRRTIIRAKSWFEARLGREIDWTDEADQGILVSRCRLDWNQATEYFEVNFHPDLVAFLIRNGVSNEEA